jgi:hypothetical protein
MRRLFTAALFAAACAPVLTAQSTQTPSSQEAAQKPPVLTVSGCLRNGEEPSTFVLTSVKWLDKTSAEKPSSVGTSGTDTGHSGATLRLVGSPSGVRMSEHVGHTVEITGTLIDEAVAAPRPKAEAAPAEQTAQPPSQQPAPKSEYTMNVRTIKMIGESCTGR